MSQKVVSKAKVHNQTLAAKIEYKVCEIETRLNFINQ